MNFIHFKERQTNEPPPSQEYLPFTFGNKIMIIMNYILHSTLEKSAPFSMFTFFPFPFSYFFPLVHRLMVTLRHYNPATPTPTHGEAGMQTDKQMREQTKVLGEVWPKTSMNQKFDMTPSQIPAYPNRLSYWEKGYQIKSNQDKHVYTSLPRSEMHRLHQELEWKLLRLHHELEW